MIYGVVVDTFLHLALLFTFLFILWYYMIRRYQQQQIDNLIEQFLHTTGDDAIKYLYKVLGTIIPQDTLHSAVDNIAKTLQYDLNKETIVLEKDHDNVRGTGLTVIILLWVIVGLASYGLYIQNPSAWKEIAVVNILLFLFLAVMEYGFYIWIIKKYVPITESEIRNVVYTQLEAKLKTLIEGIEST